MSVLRLSIHAGVSTAVIANILYPSPGRKRSQTIRKGNAAALLAVGPRDVVQGRVDATGTKRRIQALVANGWPLLQIGPHVKRHPYYLSDLLKQDRVYAYTAHDVAVGYERLWNANPQAHGVTVHASAIARTHAAKKGWVPPAAWDDELIDDPEAQSAFAPEMSRAELAAYRRQEIAHLASFGIPEHDIASRLDMAPHYVRDLIRDMRKAA
ncbi:hypothetical protein [Streptomyces sp. WM4235]|uniref:hypothetical protein n=1 Tax=Streptomyces sp. WM4235 TaxID=1415551 RepID=UPI00131CCDD9|nr:hypothetical protein [Streptomyces sp. WM4235]